MRAWTAATAASSADVSQPEPDHPAPQAPGEIGRSCFSTPCIKIDQRHGRAQFHERLSVLDAQKSRTSRDDRHAP